MRVETNHQEVISSLLKRSDHAEQQPLPPEKDSARLIYDCEPMQVPNPKAIKFQIAEVVMPLSPCGRGLFAHRAMKLMEAMIDDL